MSKCPECRKQGRLSALSLMQVEEVSEAWATHASRCTYCGVVFTIDATGSVVIRGDYDDPMGKQGWTPR